MKRKRSFGVAQTEENELNNHPNQNFHHRNTNRRPTSSGWTADRFCNAKFLKEKL